MKKRILVIPDVHGRTFWKEPVCKLIESVDKVIFLGDYLDPYGDFVQEDICQNLMEIINLKSKYQDKVVLLKGNHDQHYSSIVFHDLAGGTRIDYNYWEKYHNIFEGNKDLFKLVHMEMVNGIPYIFSHAGLTAYWLDKVNSLLWRLEDSDISVANDDIIEMINLLERTREGQELLSVIGRNRSRRGENTGSILWADVYEHPIPEAPNMYGLNKVFQVFGHTRLNGDKEDMLKFEHFAMIDSQKCIMIDEGINEPIVTLRDYYFSYLTGQ